MRTIKYISPSSLSCFYQDREEFYLRYLAEIRVPKIPQSRPMAIGSAFDAFVKNYIMGALVGSAGIPPEFQIENIFEAQVEPQNRDWALSHGERLFEAYRASGALANLMLELSAATELPRFEFTVECRVAHACCAGGIPLLGKPDAYCKLSDERGLIIDWKVNGYCSGSSPSPKPGYVRLLPSGKQHKNAQCSRVSGIDCNIASTFETVDESWAAQTCIYLWVLGEPVGTKSLVGIEQLCCAGGEAATPLRVASHRSRIGVQFQAALMDRIATMWTAIQSGTVLSQERALMLDQQAAAYGGNMEDPNERWFLSTTRRSL